jgi:ectoine hydroxylase-related dioxygenase (phytanoyl-CoA dioxygenase family)
MTPQEQYAMDVHGYLTVPDAISPEMLAVLRAAAARQEARAAALVSQGAELSPPLLEGRSPLLQTAPAEGTLLRASFFDTLDCEPETEPLIANPTIARYVLGMVERPMLEQFSLTFMYQGGEIGAHSGHTPFQSINSYQVNDGRIYCNHLRVMYYLTDVTPGCGEGGLFVLPGSHKAAFPSLHLADPAASSLRTMDEATRSMFVEIGGKAGTALIFTHDLVHCSYNATGRCRTVLHTACESRFHASSAALRFRSLSACIELA